jgi:hypothetical protein
MFENLKNKVGPMTPQQDPNLASEEEIGALKNLIQSARQRVSGLAQISPEEIEAQDREVFEAFIKAMEDSGVDTNQPDQIDAFIEDIRKRSPELADIYEQTLLSVVKSDKFSGIDGEESHIPQDPMMPMEGQSPLGEMTTPPANEEIDLTGLQ